jgi:hypothetical protein
MKQSELAGKRKLLSAYRFFRNISGGIVGYTAVTAIILARAEILAQEAGCTFAWEHDAEDWADLQREFSDHALMPTNTDICFMYDASGQLLGSLGAIWDADANYRRVAEAEVAGEVYGRGSKR